MISPMTPPGTHLVVVWVGTTKEESIHVVHPDYRHQVDDCWDPRDPFSVGDKVTLASIVPCECATMGYAARLVEHEGAFPLETFRVAQLPRSITDLLVDVPVDNHGCLELVS